MNNKINIKDKSGDKKYFTQIPNIVVNHSTAYEQSLYLIMKRLAGEEGSCYASLNFLSGKMGIHKTTVSKTITKLLKRKWIEEIENKTVRGGKVRQFIVVDIWLQNIKEYESSAEMTSKNESGAVVDESGAVVDESGAVVNESGAVVDESGAESDTKKNEEEYIKEEYTKDKELATSKKVADNKEISELIDMFKPVNPSYKRLFGNTTQRAAIQRLVKERGREDIEEKINFLPKLIGKQFAPVIHTPYELETKLASLMNYMIKQRSVEIQNRPIII